MSSPNRTKVIRPKTIPTKEITVRTILSTSSAISSEMIPSKYPINAYDRALKPIGEARYRSTRKPLANPIMAPSFGPPCHPEATAAPNMSSGMTPKNRILANNSSCSIKRMASTTPALTTRRKVIADLPQNQNLPVGIR